MTILANGGTLTAGRLYSGMGDYFGGHGCADDEDRKEFLLYAYYGRKTSLADIVDDLVSDCFVGPVGEELPEDITDDEIREAIMTDMLNDRGRADVANGAIAECSAEYADANNLNVCRMCGAGLGCEHDDDCGYVAEWRESGDWTEDDSPEVIEEDCAIDDDGEFDESPIFIALLEYTLPEAPADPTKCPDYDDETGCAECDACGDCDDREDRAKTPVDSIKIPVRFVQACVGWEGGMDCMLRAVTSTGNLTTGVTAPAGCDGDKEKWYLTIWRELSADLGWVVSMARTGCDDDGVQYDAKALAEFETWVDETIIPRLEEEYGLADWDASDG